MFSVEKVKKKWHGLRDVFRKEFNKAVAGERGEEEDGELTSRWPHFASMLFLTDTIEHRKLEGKVSSAKRTSAHFKDVEQEGDICNFASDCSNEFAPIEDTANSSQMLTIKYPHPAVKVAMDANPYPTKKCKNLPFLADDHCLQVQSKKLKSFTSNSCSIEDSDCQFLLSLLPFLRNVPSNRKLTVRHKLQQVFIDEEQMAAIASITSKHLNENGCK